MKEENLKSLYKKGKEDAIKNNYNPPHGLADELMTWSSNSTKHHVEENMAYNRGYYYILGELHSKKNKYNPPEKHIHKLEYDKGFYQTE